MVSFYLKPCIIKGNLGYGFSKARYRSLDNFNHDHSATKFPALPLRVGVMDNNKRMLHICQTRRPNKSFILLFVPC